MNSATKNPVGMTPPSNPPGDLRLEVREVALRQGNFRLSPVSFEGTTGTLTGILGPNGSGKSTLLKIISGYSKPDAGVVHLDGVSIHSMKGRQRARQVAVVAQESALHFPMTVLEYCLMARHPFVEGLQLAGAEDLEIVHQALQMTRAAPFERRWMNELSGGERQRVILARALAQQPRLLLLDEPTINLDVAFQIELLELVDRLTREQGLLVVMVTHELNLASEFAHKVLLLKNGNSLAFGSPAEVMTEERLHQVFDSELLVDQNPVTGACRITPLRKSDRSASSHHESVD
ncbi:MAG: ABC transporter ATP-binding protein [Acidobacteriia bacterium]|nr:ABC transporter ATP-binding protein [Terriglobia bacterium]